MKKYNSQFDVDQNLCSYIVHYSEDSILVTSKDLDFPGPKIVYVNPAFTKMTGYSAQEILGKTPAILQGPKTDQAVLKKLRVALDAGEVFYGMTINYRKDGSEFYNEWHIEPIKDDDGNVLYYISNQHDVTSRVKSEQAIAQKNSALKEILEQIEIEKAKIKQGVTANVQELLIPALNKLRRKGSRLDKKYLDILEKNLKDLTSSFGLKVSQEQLKLSPREIEIANLIKNGMSTKEIVDALNISFKTVETHRNKIRKKLGIVKKDINLTTYLKSI